MGLIGLAAVSGAGLAVGAAQLCRPPARKQATRNGVPSARRTLERSQRPVTYAIDRIANRSPTPATAPISVDGVADRLSFRSMA